MTNLTPEQQQVVDKAAKKYSCSCDSEDCHIRKEFNRGVTFALSTPSLYMGLMEEFAEWISKKNIFIATDMKWYRNDSNGVLVAKDSKRLVKDFFEYKETKKI